MPWPTRPTASTPTTPTPTSTTTRWKCAYQKRVHNFFVQTSADYQWRNDFRSARQRPASARARCRRIRFGINFYITPNPNAPNRQETTVWHYQLLGRYTFPWEIGFAANWRYQSGFPFSPIVADGDTSPGLNLSNFGAPFFLNNLSDDRSDNVSLLNFRLDKAFDIGRFKVSGMLDIYNVLNSEAVTNFCADARARATSGSPRCSTRGCSRWASGWSSKGQGTGTGDQGTGKNLDHCPGSRCHAGAARASVDRPRSISGASAARRGRCCRGRRSNRAAARAPRATRRWRGRSRPAGHRPRRGRCGRWRASGRWPGPWSAWRAASLQRRWLR